MFFGFCIFIKFICLLGWDGNGSRIVGNEVLLWGLGLGSGINKFCIL